MSVFCIFPPFFPSSLELVSPLELVPFRREEGVGDETQEAGVPKKVQVVNDKQSAQH